MFLLRAFQAERIQVISSPAFLLNYFKFECSPMKCGAIISPRCTQSYEVLRRNERKKKKERKKKVEGRKKKEGGRKKEEEGRKKKEGGRRG